MPKILQYTNEFKGQVVRFVFESIEPTESRKEACRRLASKVNMKEVTLYNWVKVATQSQVKGRSILRSLVRLMICVGKLPCSKRRIGSSPGRTKFCKRLQVFSGLGLTANQRDDWVSEHCWWSLIKTLSHSTILPCFAGCP